MRNYNGSSSRSIEINDDEDGETFYISYNFSFSYSSATRDDPAESEEHIDSFEFLDSNKKQIQKGHKCFDFLFQLMEEDFADLDFYQIMQDEREEAKIRRAEAQEELF